MSQPLISDGFGQSDPIAVRVDSPLILPLSDLNDSATLVASSRRKAFLEAVELLRGVNTLAIARIEDRVAGTASLRVSDILDDKEKDLISVNVRPDVPRTLDQVLYEVTLHAAGGKISVIFDRAGYEKISRDIVSVTALMLVPQQSVKSVTEHCFGHQIVEIDQGYNAVFIENILARIDKRLLRIGFRHTDLHCGNCLVSTSNFKVIDVAGSKRSSFVCDLARLEISIISRLVEKLKLSNDECRAVLAIAKSGNFSAGGRACEIGHVIAKVRQAFYAANSTEPDEVSICLAYYLELAVQLRYSIYSPVGLSPAMAIILQHWLAVLEGHLGPASEKQDVNAISD